MKNNLKNYRIDSFFRIISRSGYIVLGFLCFAVGMHTYGLASSKNDGGLVFSADSKTASYTIGTRMEQSPVLVASVAVQVDGRWLHAADFPRRSIGESTTMGLLGKAEKWTLTYAGLKNAPDLACTVRMYQDVPFGEIQMTARNSTAATLHIEAFRLIDAASGQILNLGGPADEDRVLSFSYSEDAPAISIHNLVDTENGMHVGVSSQLIYNRKSGQSWFVGALTSSRFLSVMRLHVTGGGVDAHVGSYEASSEGTTTLLAHLYPKNSPPKDRVQLSLPLASGQELASERLIFGISDNYHRQLDTYGTVIRKLHHARISAPPAFGWWSWTAYYSGISAGTALTNAQFLAQNLKSYGYNFFHLDEGYQYARGEYTTPDAGLFPHGMIALEDKVVALGLVPGLWTAPFQVADRSWVYQHHKDWLVHNTHGEPIQAGFGANHTDLIYILDMTNPGAQAYLRKTFATLATDWHIHYFKLDFMDATAMEGVYYQPNTTALEAQRIGLKIIRDAVGPDVLLDKDGSPMLNPVGYVDYGRISEDTGHTFAATKEVATGIAARYFMNRNFYVSDPDAFTVSKQTIPDGEWHESKIPLTLDEAKVSIALAAVSGSMFEIGDDLPTLAASPERMALVENRDLLDMVRLGRSSIPVDLMTYAPEDGQPSIFLLKEDGRQMILTIFNWTEQTRTHKIIFSDLGLRSQGKYQVSNVLNRTDLPRVIGGVIEVTQPRHSVRVLKIVDPSIVVRPPMPDVQHPYSGIAGKPISFAVVPGEGSVRYTWDMGDRVTLEGPSVTHTYTHVGIFTITLRAAGLEGAVGKQSFTISITGRIPTVFVPAQKQRYTFH